MSEEHKYWNPDRETLSADEFHAVQEQALLRQLDYLWARSDFYLQKFSDDQLMELLRKRLTDEECQAIFNLLSGLLRKHLSEPEYHLYFLKDKH